MIGTDGQVILGAWGSTSFDGSVQFQRWSIDGTPLDPVPHVLHHYAAGEPSLYRGAAPRVDQVVWDGSMFLVVWSTNGSVIVDRVDREMHHTDRKVIELDAWPRLVHATTREIFVLQESTGLFYSTEGRYLATIELVIPNRFFDAIDVSTDGEWFLLSGIFSVESEARMYTIALRSDRTASRAVETPLDTGSWGYAIDVAYGDGTFLVTTVYPDHYRPTIRTYTFTRRGDPTGSNVIYHPFAPGRFSRTPEILWNGSEFEMYWLPPENPVLVRSFLNEAGGVERTEAMELADPELILPRVVQKGTMRTFFWLDEGILYTDHRGVDERALQGEIASWRGQTELDPRVSSAAGEMVVVWSEETRDENGRTRRLPRGALIDRSGSTASLEIPATCDDVSIASRPDETAFVWSCGAGLTASRLDHASRSFTEPFVFHEDDVRLSDRSVAWNGEGWTVVWTQTVAFGDARIFVQRLGPTLIAERPRVELGKIGTYDGAFVYSNGDRDLVVTAQNHAETCPILCVPPPAPPVETILVEDDLTIRDRWIAGYSGGFVPAIFDVAPDPDGYTIAVAGKNLEIFRYERGEPLGGSVSVRLDGPSSDVALTTVGSDLWVARTEGDRSLWSNTEPVELSIHRFTLGPSDLPLRHSSSLRGYIDRIELDRNANGPILITSEMTTDPAHGLSARIMSRSWSEERRRPLRRR